ncbi:hypothetical protein CAAN1_08S00870 [[Candida] anglica]|uniref:Uncharacterized protein n=1 Tax=[Candida] anglica TaxID=148631 RepID=A0ABP0E639_9ASCO
MTTPIDVRIRDLLDADVVSVEQVASIADSLRDEVVRGSAAVNDSLVEICAKTATLIQQYFDTGDDSIVMEMFRLLINASANNEQNRNTLTNDISSEFWSFVVKIVSTASLEKVRQRVLIFLVQFVRNTKKAAVHAGLFLSIKLDRALLSSMTEEYKSKNTGNEHKEEVEEEEINEDLLEFELELVSELVVISNESNPLESDILLLISLFKYVTDEDLLQTLSTCVAAITKVDDLPGLGPTALVEILSLMGTLEKPAPYVSRMLFGAVGQISSMPSFDNWIVSQLAIDTVSQKGNPYQVATASIILGNCVDSNESRDKLIIQICKTISIETWINSFITLKYNDIVQYQGLHLLNHILIPEIAHILFKSQENYQGILQITKAILDNKDYYEGVYNLLNTFLKKLIGRAFVDTDYDALDLYSYKELWTLISDQNPLMVALAQAAILREDIVLQVTRNKDHLQFSQLLVTNVVEISEGKTIKLEDLLNKIQTLAMLYQMVPRSELCAHVFPGDSVQDRFDVPLLKFLEDLQQALSQTSDAPTPQMLTNNAKYIAAATTKYYEEPQQTPDVEEEIGGWSYGQVLNVCNRILKN